MSGNISDRCPFPIATAIFAAVSLVLPTVLFLSKGLPPWTPFGAQLVGITVFAAWLESRRVRDDACPWLDVGTGRRLTMYGTLWLVGLLVLAALRALDVAPLQVLSVLALLVVVPVVALLRQHLLVDHGEFEEAGVSWWLFASARLPVYFLILIGALATIFGILSLLPWMHA
jgi:hypothetical protein